MRLAKNTGTEHQVPVNKLAASMSESEDWSHQHSRAVESLKQGTLH